MSGENDWLEELETPAEATGALRWRKWRGHAQSECPQSLRDKAIFVRVRGVNDQPSDFGRTWDWRVDPDDESYGDILEYAVDACEWTDSQDGMCPVALDASVEFLMRDGSTYYSSQAGSLRWIHTGYEDDIMKYRVIEPDELEYSSS